MVWSASCLSPHGLGLFILPTNEATDEQRLGFRRSLIAGWGPPSFLFLCVSLFRLMAHVDDMDAATYAIVAHNMARDGLSLRPVFTPAGTPFLEHPPLWLWVLALWGRWFPQVPLGVASVLCGLVTMPLAYTMGQRLVGAVGAQLGLTLLALDVPFALLHSLPRLDAPLTVAYTASIVLLVFSDGRATWLFLGGLVSGLGTLVKGPPASGAPLTAALILLVIGRGRDLRSFRAWGWAGLGVILPPALFFSFDAALLGGAWRRGYLDGQVLASLDGRRLSQFGHGPLYLISAGLWARARHVFPLACLGLAPLLTRNASGRSGRIALLLWVAVPVLGFGVASRAYWFYVLPAFVPLALLAGAALADLAARLQWARSLHVQRLASRLAYLVGALILVGTLCGLSRRIEDPCPYGPIPARISRLAARGHPVGVVTAREDYASQPLLGDHAHVDVVRFLDVESAAARDDVRLLVVPSSVGPPPGWRFDTSAGGWDLWAR